MKLPTKVSILGSVASMALATMSGCDRGIAPTCDDGDTTCVASTELSAGTRGNSGSGTGDVGTKPDTTKPGSGGSTGSSWEQAYDTGVKIKTLAKTDFIGNPSVPGGEARQLVFSVTDSTLRIWASSDGATQKNINRETIYELRILSTDSIQFGWDSKTDNGLLPNAATVLDPLSLFANAPLYLTVVKMPVIAKVLEAHLTARRKTTFQVWVKARSGSVLSGNAVAIPEDSLPRLSIAATRALLFSGAALKPISSDPFTLQIP